MGANEDELPEDDGLDGQEAGDRPFIDEVPSGSANQLAVEDDLVEVGNNSTTVIVDGIEIPGATEVTMGGEGRESQYLRETQPGGDSDGEYGFENQPSGGGDGGGEYDPLMGGNPSGGEEPPLQITITGHAGQQTAEELKALRDQDEVFTVEVFGQSYEDMELHDFTRELAGDRPYAYSIRVEVREWREADVEGADGEYFTDSGSASGGDAQDPANTPRAGANQPGSGGGGGGGSNAPDDAEAATSGETGDPEVYDLEEGEQRDLTIGDGETAEHILFDTSADGAGARIYADGDDWTIRDIGWRGDDNRSGIVAAGSGTVHTIYLGDGGDAGIFGENLHRIDLSGVRLQDADNGIYLTDGSMDDLPVS